MGFKQELAKIEILARKNQRSIAKSPRGLKGNSHCNCSHADSMIPIRKELHSSRWIILAIRSDT
jgi:hypothetical protein